MFLAGNSFLVFVRVGVGGAVRFNNYQNGIKMVWYSDITLNLTINML